MRIATQLGGGLTGWSTAIVLQAILFGLIHAYAGQTAIISTAFTAQSFGIFFHLARRSLWPLVSVHGLWDSLAVILIFLNGVPST